MSDKHKEMQSYVRSDGLMNALYTDDIVLDLSTVCFKYAGKYEEALNEKIRENENALVLHCTLGLIT